MYQDVFAQMKGLLAQRAELQRRIERAIRRAPDVRSPRLDGMPRGAHADDTLGELEALSALVRERDEVERALAACRERVEPLVEALPAGPRRVAFRLRYVDWLPVEEVARRTGYERRYAYRLLETAERAVGRGVGW